MLSSRSNSVKVAVRHGYFALFSGLVNIALLCEVSAGAWSPFYCMARQILFDVAFMATLSYHQRKSLRGIAADPNGRTLANSQHSHITCKTISSPSPHRHSR
ncbi:hypothetical protein PoB_001307500 [Plakobranchus ocellatus]|uniref:G-protein coupled receptors family 1 profile domain-containing protein n=1 Tax=Plakobranchus ocellatus TaxID=259542 RepID=A0AAV3YTP4_9GAST|nr:hypothetical protein PoB_001307500 [Plakobranchus ocellatus]